MRFARFTLAVLACLLFVTADVSAQNGQLIKLNGTTTAYALNNRSQVVGQGVDKHGNSFAFLYERAWKKLPSLGGNYAVARAINYSGHIAGTSLTHNNEYHAFVYANGKTHDIGQN